MYVVVRTAILACACLGISSRGTDRKPLRSPAQRAFMHCIYLCMYVCVYMYVAWCGGSVGVRRGQFISHFRSLDEVTGSKQEPIQLMNIRACVWMWVGCARSLPALVFS